MNDFFKKYKYLFFDFDGVIVDSVNIKTKAFAELFKDYGEDIVKKVVDYHIKHGGVSRYEKFRYYYKHFLGKDITEEEIKKLDKKFSEIVYKQILKAPFIEGVLSFLNVCLKSKKKMFIISATPHAEIRKIVKGKGLEKYFIDIVGSPVTKKENISFLLNKYRISPDEAAYFGDSSGDLEAAEKHKIFFVPINYFDRREGFKSFGEFMLKMGIK